MPVRKHYVDVLVLFTSDGNMVPRTVFWDDQKRFQIDRVLDVREAASRKAGGQGARYLCLINGSQHALFFEDPAWFVEERVEKKMR